jgi:hypothetical protein
LPLSEVVSRYVELKKAGTRLRGLSPFNKERTPSFYVDDDKGLWKDWSSGHGGNVFTFLMKIEGLPFPAAVRECGRQCGIAVPEAGEPPTPVSPEFLAKATADREERHRLEAAKQAESERHRINLAREIARRSRPFAMGDGSPPALFFESRGLVMPAEMSPRALLYCASCPFNDDEGKLVHYPALIGLFRDIFTDQIRAIARRPLTLDGRSLAKPISLGPAKGCVIKLSDKDEVGRDLHLAEGITSALAGVAYGMMPIWVTGGTGTLAKFPVLDGIEKLTLIVDNDENGASQTAAGKTYDRWTGAGRQVWTVMSEIVGQDLADVLLAQLCAEGGGHD